ncbi:MAG TPA: transketolase [Treponemataceae bacterium]|nr:transketolase [Treponemataceae bacterium]
MDTKSLKAVAASIRSLSIDAIQAANSGHPGLPLGAAELAAVLYGEIMKHNPANSKWKDRDRFVLSAGHGSMLIYAILHLAGYKITLDDIKNFRQLDSICPGHPEYGITDGVEATTGPLGQGIAMAVGMAIAEKMLAAKFNTKKNIIVDHYTYTMVGEGCLMEGISYEACSFAGSQKLGKLIVFYDCNKVSIDGKTCDVFSEDIEKRFVACGWHVQSASMYEMENICSLVNNAKSDERPSLIILDSVIGKYSPFAGMSDSHGAPLGVDNVKATKKAMGIPENKDYYVLPEAYKYFENKKASYAKAENDWNREFDAWKKENPSLAIEWDAFWNEKTIADIKMPEYEVGSKLATRSASGDCLSIYDKAYKNIVGGSADLQGPNKTNLESDDFCPANPEGRYIRYGVREFAMAAISNGIALHGGLKPFCATFMVFADYLRPALRLSALQNVTVLYIFTHDSIFVGEDGPTHQPIETISALRSIPNVQVLRPGDAEETVVAWEIAMESKNMPVCLSLTRQDVPVYEKEDPDWKNTIKCGAYIVKKGSTNPDVTILATGSEVSMALKAAKISNKKVRVVSVLDRELFRNQPSVLKETIVGVGRTMVVEAGTKMGWEGFVSCEKDLFCIDQFGSSAPGNKVAEGLGFTAKTLAALL